LRTTGIQDLALDPAPTLREPPVVTVAAALVAVVAVLADDPAAAAAVAVVAVAPDGVTATEAADVVFVPATVGLVQSFQAAIVLPLLLWAAEAVAAG